MTVRQATTPKGGAPARMARLPKTGVSPKKNEDSTAARVPVAVFLDIGVFSPAPEHFPERAFRCSLGGLAAQRTTELLLALSPKVAEFHP